MPPRATFFRQDLSDKEAQFVGNASRSFLNAYGVRKTRSFNRGRFYDQSEKNFERRIVHKVNDESVNVNAGEVLSGQSLKGIVVQ